MSVFYCMVIDEYCYIFIKFNDLVIIFVKVIFGNEVSVLVVLNFLIKKEVKVVY